MAKRVDLVQATVNDTSAVVQQTSQALVDLNGKVSATWTVKCQVNSAGKTYAAGLGLGVEQQPDGSYQSQILFQADRFALLNVANGATSTPFVIAGGQTFIDQAFIQDGSIVTAKIANAAITNAQIANGAIKSAQIGEAEIDTLRIQKDAVTIPSFYQAPKTGVPAGYVATLSVSPSITTKFSIIGTARFYGTYLGGVAKCQAILYVDGQNVDSFYAEGSVLPAQIQLSQQLDLAPGDHTIQLYATSNLTNPDFGSATLLALGVKR